MTALPPVVEPVTITGPLSIRPLSDDVKLPSLTGLHLPLFHFCSDHLDTRTNPFHIIKGYLPLDRYVGMVPLLTIHFVDRPTNDAVITDRRVMGGLDTEFHFTDSCEDDHGDGSSLQSQPHASDEDAQPGYPASELPERATNRTDPPCRGYRTCAAR
jgi:hypothetical protein